MTLGLGDSVCCRIRDNKTEQIIMPRRFHGHPCLVTTAGACKAMTVKLSETRFGDILVLYTDGFADALNQDGGRIGSINSLLRQGSYTELNSRLDKLEIQDDCSYIALSRTR